ncbi:MAG: FecR domain-containing protein [Spirochaeta sp.]|nr:FecR domain-containing protein [Spirochaeta sp.]
MRRGNLRVFCTLLMFAAAASAVAADGTVSYFEGEVLIRRGTEILEADFGTDVFQGDVVSTGANATVVIRLGDRADIKLRDNTSVEIESVGTSMSVGLNSGGIFSRVIRNVRGDFHVRAGTVVGGVRGTEFFVAYGRTIEDYPDVWLCVNDGEVFVRVTETAAEMPVRAGEGVNVLAGLRLTDAERYRWTEQLNWAMDPSEGEVYDDTDLDAAYSDLLDFDYD